MGQCEGRQRPPGSLPSPRADPGTPQIRQAQPRRSLNPPLALLPEGTPGACPDFGQEPERPQGQLAPGAGPVLPLPLDWRPGGPLQPPTAPSVARRAPAASDVSGAWAPRESSRAGADPILGHEGTLQRGPPGRPGTSATGVLCKAPPTSGSVWLPALGDSAWCVPREPRHAELQQPDRGSGSASSPSPRSWEAPESRLGAMCVPAQHRAPGGLPADPRRQQRAQPGAPGSRRTRPLSRAPVPQGPRGALSLSVIQSLGCRFGSSSPAKDSAELPWPVGVWSQHPLSLRGLAPAGGTRLGKRNRGCGRRQGSAGLELGPVRVSQPTDAGWPGASVSLL